MKNLLSLILLFSQIIYAQMPAAVQQDLMNFEPGELIVKLKDNVDAEVTYAENGKAMSSFNIGELLGIEEKIESSSVMFHQKSIEASIVNKENMKAVYAAKAAANPNNGYVPKEPLTMKNIFVLKTLNEQENILMLIEQIKNNPNVEYAEPNYIYSISDFEVGDIVYDDTDGETEDQEGSSETSSVTIEVDDPLYSSQANIVSTNIDDVWDQYTTGDGSQVIAIIDTGGDYTHPDLEANTWINTEELNGVEGYDDDGNGYIDDIRGWDFIHEDNVPLDDNMHGTHVAGIAGAVGNNGIGIAGAAWDVKLMHIKAFNASGSGDILQIAQAVEYASNNGATIINMSFGSYQLSLTFQLALENAYATSTLVGSAGNDGIPIGPDNGGFPHFPSAFSFVIGVEDRPFGPSSPTQMQAGYTNWDQDGPTFSLYSELWNYELASPGTTIISTIPNGGYAPLTGTSMSTPLVSGALALYKEEKPDESQELMFGNLINSPGPIYVDFYEALNITPIPQIKLINAVIVDTIPGNTYQDFEPDIGETIHIYPTIKNYWGFSNGAVISIEVGTNDSNEFQNEYWNSLVTISEQETTTGSISSFATYQQLTNPLEIIIADDAPHNSQVKFTLKTWDIDNPDLIHDIIFSFKIKSSIKLQGLIENDTILTADKEYLIDNNFIIKHSNLIIKPGVIISFGNNQILGTSGEIQLYTEDYTDPVTGETTQKASRIIALGTRDSLITFKRDASSNGLIRINGNSLGGNYGTTVDSLDDILNLNLNSIPVTLENGEELVGSICNYCDFQAYIRTEGMNVMNSKYSSDLGSAQDGNNMFLYRNNFSERNNAVIPISSNYGFVHHNNIVGIHSVNSPGQNTNTYGIGPWKNDWKNNNIYNSSKEVWTFVNEIGYTSGLDQAVGFLAPSSDFTQFEGVWIGAGTIEKLEELNIDAFDGSQGVWEYDNPKLEPFEEAHAVVWKVEVNGINGFDNYLAMYNNPIGVGTHEFKVYFNREMDTNVDPQISYGVITPYVQNSINEEGTWSEDGKIYTVNHEINIGASDGINRIRITEAVELIDKFKVLKEDLRFDILIQSAGSASLGWFATPGLGKIALTWEAPSAEEIDDALGYNMYRYQVDTDGVESTPVKLNESLIVEDTDESTTGVYYTDFNVTEGQTYFYKYNILRTSFETTDYSSVVSSAPLTSTLGDSNGDFAVDVLDLVHDVDYILGNNPTPFIFLAGDVNADNAINVLDIVGTVDIILNPSDLNDSSIGSTDIQFYPSASIGNATFSWEGNDLYVESDHNIGGLQLAFSNDFEYSISSELSTIEKLDYIQDDNKIVMLFSFNNTVISSGKTKLLTRLDETKDLNIDLAVVGTTSGSKLTAIFEDTNLEDIESPFQSDSLEFLSMIPNPTSGMVNLKYYLPEQMNGVVAKVYDIQGRLVWSQRLENMEGASETQMNLNKLQTGNYIVLISGNKNGGLKTLAHKMLIVK